MKTSLLLGIALLFNFKISYAQDNQISSIPLVFEKVYLQTDRNDYVAGEDIWFKAYLLDARSNKLTENSNNLYVELISPSAQIISKKVIRLNNGLGDSYFKLLDSIPAGKYNIRAYTNWMRNYGDLFIFNKEINIHQPDQKITAAINEKTKTPLKKAIPQTNLSTQETIQLFPEGGAMINNVANLIAFKAEDETGKGISAKGEVMDTNEEIITSFETSHLGMGSFYLAQQEGRNYHLKGKFDNGKVFNLPILKALNKGFNIHTQQTETITRIIISTNEASLNDWKGKEFKLFAKSKSKVVYEVKFTLENAKTTIDIKNRDLAIGINIFTLYDDQNKPYAERLIYIEKWNPLKFNLQTDKAVYQSKEKTTVKINLLDIYNQPVKGMLSLAVVDTKIASIPTESIVSYVMLQSEIKGEIEQPELYFNKADANRLKNLDLLLLTQGWRDFVWKSLEEKKVNISFMPEQGFNISGQVRQVKGNKGIHNANITLSIPGANDGKLFSTLTDTAGRYYFDGISFYGNQTVNINSRGSKGQELGRILLDSSVFKSPKLDLKPIKKNTEIYSSPNLLVEMNRRKQLKAKLSITDTIGLKEVKVKADVVSLWDDQLIKFGYPDQVFNITEKDHDYNNLRHYLLTNVKGAFSEPDIPKSGLDARGKNGVVFRSFGTWIHPRIVINKRDLAFNNNDSEQMLDDIYNTYYSILMSDIEKVVVKHQLLGARMTMNEESGTTIMGRESDVFLIYLTLKPGALLSKELDVIRTVVSGYEHPRTFYAPKYIVKNQTPDVRNTIHWEPNITTDEKGEATITFYNADTSTQIRVIAEGISDTGVPLLAVINYQIVE